MIASRASWGWLVVRDRDLDEASSLQREGGWVFSRAVGRLLTFALSIHAFAELSAGAVMVLAPESLRPDAPFAHLEAMRGVGIGASCVGLLGLLLLFERSAEVRRVGLAALAPYHVGIVALQLRLPMAGIPPLTAPIFHGFLALVFALSIFRLSRSPARRSSEPTGAK